MSLEQKSINGKINAVSLSAKIDRGAVIPNHASRHLLGGLDPITTLPTVDQKAALAGTGTPSVNNKYVTADSLASQANMPTSDQKAALNGATTASETNAFATIDDLPPTPDLTNMPTADQKAALDGATTALGSNPFATMSDVSNITGTNHNFTFNGQVGLSGADLGPGGSVTVSIDWQYLPSLLTINASNGSGTRGIKNLMNWGRVTIINRSASYNFTLYHNDSGTDGVKFFCPGAVDFVLAPNKAVEIVFQYPSFMRVLAYA